MTATYLCSDLHLQHKNIYNFRTQFNNVEEHDTYIKERYHQTVRPKDHVYFLGDVAFTLEALQDLKTWPGIKHLILGNHDKQPDKKGITIHDLLNVYDDIHGFIRYKEFWFSHAPIHTDELRGRFSIHGHTHSHIIDDPRYLNVCVEHTDYKPISLDAIRNIFKSRTLL